MTQADDVVTGFSVYTFFKLICQFISAAGEHKILPHDETHLVAGIIENIRRIMTAAPNTDCVKIGFLRIF